ncbi:MAG: endonuclease/exonuclease/phosphatase family protein [Minisyncoccia bacterium]
MRLISLNMWGGRLKEELITFLVRERETTDIFCFQEVFQNASSVRVGASGIQTNPELYAFLVEFLPGHTGYFRPTLGKEYGIATFVRPNLSVTHEDALCVYREEGYIPPEDRTWDHPRLVQSLTLSDTPHPFHIFNFHGTSGGGDKEDSDARIQQSSRLATYITQFSGRRVLCGDFNLLPDTKSMGILEDIPLRNLTREYGITSTRSARYNKGPRYADYVLVSSDVTVRDFEVLGDDVSDHTPLLLDFE